MGQSRVMAGPEDFRGVYNGSGADIAANKAVMLDSTENQVVLPSGTTVRLAGVTTGIVPDKGWGEIQIRGRTLVSAAGALSTPGVALMPDTDGKAQLWAAIGGTNATFLGQLINKATAEDDLVEVELAEPAALQQGA